MKPITRTLTEREFLKLEKLQHFFSEEQKMFALKSVAFETEPQDLDTPLKVSIQIKNYTQKTDAQVLDSALKIVRELLKF